MSNTLYIAEPIFSAALQKLDSTAEFPPIKKIGITTGYPDRREKELTGTLSPIKISIIGAWTNIDARRVELMLHQLLDNSRIDGEYFWDGNDSLFKAVERFIKEFYPDARFITTGDTEDVVEAKEMRYKNNFGEVESSVIRPLVDMGLKVSPHSDGEGVEINLGTYTLTIRMRTGGRFTMTIYSDSKTTNDALDDFKHSQEPSANAKEDGPRVARIPLASIGIILESIQLYVDKIKQPISN